MDRLATHGFKALETLDTRQIKGKLWEIKFRRKNRIFYVVAENNCIYLLHVCKTERKG